MNNLHHSQNNKIVINKKLFISKGERRKCYVHPTNNSLVIKVQYSELNKNINQREFDNYIKVKRKAPQFSEKYLCKIHKLIETNEGIAQVCDNQFANEFSYSMADFIADFSKMDQKTHDEFFQLVSQFIADLALSKIQIYDLHVNNFICYKKNKSSALSIKLIDFEEIDNPSKLNRRILNIFSKKIYLNINIKRFKKRLHRNFKKAGLENIFLKNFI